MNEIEKDPAKCQGIVRSTGEQCRKAPSRGTSVCIKHGANAPQTRASAAAVVAEQRERLARVLVPKAVQALEKIVADKKATDSDRIRAANSILDRGGIQAGTTLLVEHDADYRAAMVKQAEEVRQRLEAYLGNRLAPALPDPNVIDAEIVGEDVSEGEQAEVLPFRPSFI